MFLSGNSLQSLIEELVLYPISDPTYVIKLFGMVLVGDTELHEEIWNAIMLLSRGMDSRGTQCADLNREISW
jgi:hypothetical protein